MKSHFALYGNQKMKRAFCDECDSWALVLDGKLACCDKPFLSEVKTVKRMSEPEDRRAKPRAQEQAEILQAQFHCCFYCHRPFGSHVMLKGKPVRLRVAWDHMIPFALLQNNYGYNFVAACHVCNGWKSDHVFQDATEAQIFLAARWEREIGADDDE